MGSKNTKDSLEKDHHKLYLEMLEPHRIAIYNFFLNRTRNIDLAEDLTQETLFRAYRYILFRTEDEIREIREIKQWLVKIATNVYLNEFRKHNIQPEPFEILYEKAGNSLEEPEVAFEEAEYINKIRRVTLELPARFRRILILNLFHEMTSTEIAEFLNRPVTSVRADLSYGRKQLRKQLEEGSILK